jgi:predicted ribosomally synthesized peptide with SipW-like signal peptide
MKKKILIISLVVAVLATAVIGGTLAWFTDTETATNTFTVGNVDIMLREPLWNGADFNDLTMPADAAVLADTTTLYGIHDAQDIVPGEVIDKDPQVRNVGVNPCWVRLKITVPNQGGELPDVGQFFDFDATAWESGAWSDVDTNLDGTFDESVVYAYLTEVLQPDSQTVAAFTTVTIPGTLNNQDMASFGEDLKVIVVAEAIQSDELGALTCQDAFTGQNIQAAVNP